MRTDCLTYTSCFFTQLEAKLGVGWVGWAIVGACGIVSWMWASALRSRPVVVWCVCTANGSSRETEEWPMLVATWACKSFFLHIDRWACKPCEIYHLFPPIYSGAKERCWLHQHLQASIVITFSLTFFFTLISMCLSPVTREKHYRLDVFLWPETETEARCVTNVVGKISGEASKDEKAN